MSLTLPRRICARPFPVQPRELALFLLLSALFAAPAHSAGDVVTLKGKAIRYWTFQLQGTEGGALDLTPLQENSQVDLAVVDYSRDGSEQGEFSSNEIQALATSKAARRGRVKTGQ